MKLKTIEFECPQFSGIDAYKTALGVEGDVGSIYPINYSEEFGLESMTYPIFTPEGNIKLKINPKKYTKIIEFTDSNAPKYRDFWQGVYKEAKLARVGFEIKVIDFRAPLRLLFEKLTSLQASTLFQNGTWGIIKCWDGVCCEPADFENGSWTTERNGAIFDIKASEGEGFYETSFKRVCGETPIPESALYGGSFSIRFLEAKPRLLR